MKIKTISIAFTRTMHRIFKTLIFAIISVSANSYANTNRFMEQCVEAEKLIDSTATNATGVNAGYCLGYLEGARQALQISSQKKICFPENGIENGQALKIFLKYMRENPQQLHEDKLLNLIRAFYNAFPCK